MNGLFWRAIFAFLALPGVVAFVVPWLLLDRPIATSRFEPDGLIALLPGIFLLLWCVRDFYIVGRGTLAPWTPPTALVVHGPYRFSRNPMYVAVLLVLCGWALGFRSRAIAIYAIVVMAAFHLRVVFGEEPWLARVHGDAWHAYRSRVPRWLGRTHGELS
jgi:protein-S-isoprenylcysteine O-methyltransferase Ste14